MLIITKENNSIKVVGQNNPTYPYSGSLIYPLNSVTVVTDKSNMAVFRSALNNDVLFTGLIDDITIDGNPVTKEDIGNKFGAISNSASTGGGSSYTAGEGIDISETNVISVDKETLNIPTLQTNINGSTNNYVYSTGNINSKKTNVIADIFFKNDNSANSLRCYVRYWGNDTIFDTFLTIPNADSTSAGAMSSLDKTKLDSIDVASILSRITALETQMGAVSAKLDNINGEVVV